MRILFSDFTLPQLLKDSEFPVGGWAVQLKILLTALAALKHRSGVLTWKGANGSVGDQSICDLVETYDPNRGMRKLRLLYQAIPAKLAAARSYNPDVILQSCAGIDTAVLAFIAARLKVPFAVRLACNEDSDDRQPLYLRRYEYAAFRWGLQQARTVICQNDYQYANMKRRFPQTPLLLLPNAIECPTEWAYPAPRVKRSHIAWIGNFRRIKNVGLLYRVASQARSIEFRVAGMRAQEVDPETLSALTKLESLPNVRLVGYLKRSDVFSFLSSATALLCTSISEGAPNTFLEAFATGTPVITRAGVDPSDIIARNRLGTVAADDDQLVKGVRDTWKMDSDDYHQLAQRCRAYVEAHHQPSKIANALATHLQSLISPRVSQL